MDHPRLERETFTEMGTNPWMSRQDMIKFVSLIVKNGGYYRRTGDSTTFEVRKQVDADTISLDMTVLPFTVLVTGEIQPCMDRLFDEEDWDAIKNVTPDGPYRRDHYLGGLPMNDIMIISGGGYKPHFKFYAYDRAMLAVFVQILFKVDV